MNPSPILNVLNANVVTAPFDSDRFSLIPSNAKLGEVVRVNSSGKFYLVNNTDNLGNATGYVEINTGNSGVIITPALGGFGIDISASSGVPLFAAGVPTFVSTNGTGDFLRATSPIITTPTISTITSAAGVNLVFSTGTTGTALAFASATNIATFTNVTDATTGTASSGSIVIPGGVSIAKSLNIGTVTPGNISGSAGSITIAAAGTNQIINLVPSGNGGVNIGASDIGITRDVAGGVKLRVTNGGAGSGALQVSSMLAVGSAGIGYGAGAGGAQTQATSRTTTVVLNTICGAITLFTAAGSVTATSFTVTNSTVAITDTIVLSVRSGTNKYMVYVTTVAAGSFEITFQTTGGVSSDAPIINFAVIKAVAA